MATANSLFLAQMAASRAEGDFTLKCQGEVIKAHFFVLRMRYALYVCMKVTVKRLTLYIFNTYLIC